MTLILSVETKSHLNEIKALNNKILAKINNICKLTCFEIYNINTQKKCPFWNEDIKCSIQDCTVIPEENLPMKYRQKALSSLNQVFTPTHLLVQDKDFCFMDDQDTIPINLSKNKERYTGYGGKSAERVWSAIYNENCFDKNPFIYNCIEKKVFYQLISGLHTSINAHICKEWLDVTTGLWVFYFDVD